MAFYQKEIECMPRDELRKLQSERLVWQVKRMYENVELFRKRMDEKGLKPEDIHGVEDLSKLPFSYKQDLRDYYPWYPRKREHARYSPSALRKVHRGNSRAGHFCKRRG